MLSKLASTALPTLKYNSMFSGIESSSHIVDRSARENSVSPSPTASPITAFLSIIVPENGARIGSIEELDCVSTISLISASVNP